MGSLGGPRVCKSLQPKSSPPSPMKGHPPGLLAFHSIPCLGPVLLNLCLHALSRLIRTEIISFTGVFDQQTNLLESFKPSGTPQIKP